MAQEIPGNLPKGDVTEKLVDEMTERDLKALTLYNFRMLQEIVDFTRQLSQSIAELQNGGMMQRMLGQSLGGSSGLISPSTLAAAKSRKRA